MNFGVTKPSPFKLVYGYGINCWMSFWKLIMVDVVNNWNLLWMQIEMRSWTCFGRSKSTNLDFVTYTIASNHLPSMVNNTSSSLVAMEPWRKLNFWTLDFEQQALQWTSLVGEMMTFATWQFPHFFEMEV
jgi:hypothetical protein